jgi:hypothetical protein
MRSTARAVSTNDSEEDALLDAVTRDYDADEPRRAYAAWLLARGCGYGAFILESLEPARADGKRLEALRKAHARGWLGGLAKLVPRYVWAYRRGLPSHIQGSASALVHAAPDIARKAPRARLDVWAMTPRHIAPLAPLLARHPGRQLLTEDFTEPAVVRLCEAGGLADVEHAKLSCALGDRGLSALAAHAHGLHSLAMGHADDLRPLLASRLPLSTLHAATHRLGAALADYAVPLSTLVIALDDFDDDDVDRLLARPSAQKLSWLGLSRRSDAPTGLSAAGAVRLARGLRNLRVLNLGGTWGLTREAATEIQAMLDGIR